MFYTYNLYSSDQLGFTNSYHIQTELPPHKFRAIMMEFRRGGNNDPHAFVKYMREHFPDSFRLFEYDDVVQYDADQENSVILSNLLDQNNQTI
ncbi:hypothetical protein [Neobacillus rhizophilus]|uniref:Uncharacterized protein n=1 Tax=Neobacillus rhizophilus TaxID=2833579 RepID=A0A942YWL3_9BACI|nr:hypothetical protein [Neobacillus rhizophilus]MBS4215189.1 hypothetical protein [Neobacillus rhizophilus]